MTWMAAAAFVASVVVALTVDPLAVGIVRETWRYAIVRWLASISDLGNSEWYLVPAGLAVIAVALADWTAHGRRVRARLSWVFGQATYLFAAVAMSGILVNLAKLVVGRARPILYDTLGPIAFRPLQFQYEYLGYPSGHSTTAGAVGLALILLLPRLRPAVLAVSALVAFTRVPALAHYPGDVIAGYAFGFLVSLWMARWLAARSVVFRVVPGRLLPVPRHGRAWRRQRRDKAISR